MNLVLTNHPLYLSGEVSRACALVRADASPAFVPIAPAPEAKPNKCIFNARREESTGRGRCVVGWKILTWPRVLAQFIGHAVVQHEERLTCVTPDLYGAKRILFLADDSLRFDAADPMARMPTRYVPFDDDPLVTQFISVVGRIDGIKAQYPPTSGNIAITPAEFSQLQRLQAEQTELIRRIALRKLSNGDRCVCDSGKKFGKCCKPKMLGAS